MNNQIEVYSDRRPGTVKTLRYIASRERMEVEGVPIHGDKAWGYFIVNKTSYPITLTEVYYDDGVLIPDSTRVYTVNQDDVAVVSACPRFRNRAAPATLTIGTGRDGHPANGYFYSVEIPEVEITYWPDDDDDES